MNPVLALQNRNVSILTMTRYGYIKIAVKNGLAVFGKDIRIRETKKTYNYTIYDLKAIVKKEQKEFPEIIVGESNGKSSINPVIHLVYNPILKEWQILKRKTIRRANYVPIKN